MVRCLKDAIPKYSQLKDILYREIKNGKFKEGDKFYSERELVKRFDISRNTAIESLRILENEGVIARIQGKGTFIAVASSIREFGIIFFDLGPLTYVRGILSGITERREGNDCHLQFFTIEGREIRKKDSLLKNLILKHKLQGLFIMSPISIGDLLFFQKEKMPFVVVNNEYPTLKVNTVVFDFYKASKETVERLIREGHKKIGLLSGMIEKEDRIIRSGEQALSGYKEVLSENSILFNPSLVKQRGQYEGEGYSAMEEFASLPQKPSALFIPSAVLAAGAYKFVREKGLEGEITIVGLFDDEKKFIPPGFLMSLSKLGKTSLELLEDSMESTTGPRQVKIPLEMVWK